MAGDPAASIEICLELLVEYTQMLAGTSDTSLVAVAPHGPQQPRTAPLPAGRGQVVDEQVEPAWRVQLPAGPPDLPGHRLKPALLATAALDHAQLDRAVFQYPVGHRQLFDRLDVASGHRDEQHQQRCQIGDGEEQL